MIIEGKFSDAKPCQWLLSPRGLFFHQWLVLNRYRFQSIFQQKMSFFQLQKCIGTFTVWLGIQIGKLGLHVRPIRTIDHLEIVHGHKVDQKKKRRQKSKSSQSWYPLMSVIIFILFPISSIMNIFSVNCSKIQNNRVSEHKKKRQRLVHQSIHL